MIGAIEGVFREHDTMRVGGWSLGIPCQPVLVLCGYKIR